jgi:dTDP-4-dehydrorhamnose 3,5-epimerase
MPNTQQQSSLYQPHSSLQLTPHFYRTPLKGLFYFQAKKHADQRGFFSEIIKLPELEQVVGFEFQPKQVNYAQSKTNVVRGLHAEGWNKLVTVVSGQIFSAIADIRPHSETYKQTVNFKLSYDENQNFGNGLFISQGLANSICVLQGPVRYLYLVDELYENRHKKDDLSISIFDPELDINWPLAREEMILSKRDENAVSLQSAISQQV